MAHHYCREQSRRWRYVMRGYYCTVCHGDAWSREVSAAWYSRGPTSSNSAYGRAGGEGGAWVKLLKIV